MQKNRLRRDTQQSTDWENPVTALILASATVLVAVFSHGLHRLQSALERWDYDRHFDD
jgi:hypothetical protein